jgi:hypothetical protein
VMRIDDVVALFKLALDGAELELLCGFLDC